jgi:hypothetical protein
MPTWHVSDTKPGLLEPEYTIIHRHVLGIVIWSLQDRYPAHEVQVAPLGGLLSRSLFETTGTPR